MARLLRIMRKYGRKLRKCQVDPAVEVNHYFVLNTCTLGFLRFSSTRAAFEGVNSDLMDLESLEQLGVPLSADVSRQQRAEQVRQQRDTELENRQHLWRWLIVEAMLLLVLETWLAGRAVGKLQSELSTV